MRNPSAVIPSIVTFPKLEVDMSGLMADCHVTATIYWGKKADTDSMGYPTECDTETEVELTVIHNGKDVTDLVLPQEWERLENIALGNPIPEEECEEEDDNSDWEYENWKDLNS